MTRAPKFEAKISDPVFPVTFRAFSEGIYGHGVIEVNGLEATSGTDNWDVNVGTGTVQYGGNQYNHPNTVTRTLADPSGNDYPRWDTVYFDTADNTAKIKTGVHEQAPSPPGITDGEVLIAYIEVDPAATSIGNGDIRNWRSRPQPAENTPIDHADVDGATVHEALGWLFDNKSSADHDHTGETINPDDMNATTASVDNAPSNSTDVVRKSETDAIESNLSDVESQTNTNETNISDHETRISDNESAIGSHGDRIGQAESDIDTLEQKTQIDNISVAHRNDLPDPTTVTNPTIAYIIDEDTYVELHQS